MQQDHATVEWTAIIKPRGKWFDLRLRELWQYRDLIVLFVRRDFVKVYKQTILGPLWYLIQPLITTVAFTIVFSGIASLPTDGLPPFLFYMCGNVAWRYFAESLTTTSMTFIANARLFGKVFFPRLAVPVSILISNMISFVIQFAFFLLFVACFYLRGAPIYPNVWMLLTPILLLLMAGLGLGFGIVVSALTTRYRDLVYLVTFGMQLFMYATPIVYPLSAVPAAYHWLALANPMTPIIETFRYAFLGAGTADVLYLAYSAVFTLVLLLFGILLFNRVERTFMDTV